MDSQDGGRSSHGGAKPPTAQAAVEEAVGFVLKAVNGKREHTPPLSASSTVYPFEIAVQGGGGRGSGLHQTVKKLLQHAAPPPVLG